MAAFRKAGMAAFRKTGMAAFGKVGDSSLQKGGDTLQGSAITKPFEGLLTIPVSV